MTEKKQVIEKGWATRVGLVLAMAGNAVGLGNFLRFPAQAAQNGGGAFMIPYLVSFLLMGIPLLWIEWAIGRNGGKFGRHSLPGMMDKLGKNRLLKYFGAVALFVNLIIVCYYCYIESWTLAYAWHSIIGTFHQIDPKAFFPTYLGIHENSLLSVPKEAICFFLITVALNIWILSRGLAGGIELTAKICMPLLLVFGAILAIRGLFLTTADPGVIQSPLEGLNFVWQPQLSGIFNPSTWLAAAGQIFFTLSLGVGSVHCFAAYVREKDDIALNAVSAGWINEFAEVILGGTILIPIATAYLGLNAVQSATAGGSGFGLGFLTLPSLFNNWGWFTPFAGAMWFGLLFFAGITSSLALAQPIMAFLEDEYRFKRNPSAISVGILILVIGFFCIWLYPGGALDEFDYWAGTFGLVLFALLEIFAFISIFGIKDGWAEITRGADIKISLFFRWTIRYVTPTFITIIFITSLIKPKAAWGEAFSQLFSGAGWPLASDSVIGKILHVGEKIVWFENGQPTKVFVLDLSRMLLTVIFVLICILVHRIFKKKVGKDS